MDAATAETTIRDHLKRARNHLHDFRNLAMGERSDDRGITCGVGAIREISKAIHVASDVAGVPTPPPFNTDFDDGNSARMNAFRIALILERVCQMAEIDIADAIPRHSLIESWD